MVMKMVHTTFICQTLSKTSIFTSKKQVVTQQIYCIKIQNYVLLKYNYRINQSKKTQYLWNILLALQIITVVYMHHINAR
uniref:Uncharacterized protein n=1 Tax=Anguilla anguilla TaxID=7936 RepID=A0A0E9SFS3_ANGAN